MNKKLPSRKIFIAGGSGMVGGSVLKLLKIKVMACRSLEEIYSSLLKIN